MIKLRKNKRIGIAISLFCAGWLISCNGVFYQPSKNQFADPTQMGFEPQDIYLTSRNAKGKKIILHAWFFPAANPKGTVVQFHGNAQNITSHFYSLVWLTRKGYNLFTFDYRGYGKSEDTPTRQGVRQDALVALEYIMSLDPSKRGPKTILYGQSLGGIIAMESLIQLAEQSQTSDQTSVKQKSARFLSQIDLLVLDSTFSSYQKLAKNKSYSHCLLWPAIPLTPLLISDTGAPEKKLHYLKDFPKLIIHGDADQVIPIQFGKTLFQKMPEPKNFWLIPQGRHIQVFFLQHGKYRQKFLDFLKK